MKDKQVVVAIPEWLKDVKDDAVAGVIFALMFDQEWEGKAKDIPNLKEYIKSVFDDMTDAQIAQIANLLIEHKIAK